MPNTFPQKNKEKDFAEDPVWRTFDALPESIKDILTGTAFEKRIDAIAGEEEVTEKVPDILRISEEVLLGTLPIRKFVQTLQGRARLTEGQARTIGYAIRDQIFAEAARDLARIHHTSRPPSTPPPHAPTPKIEGNTVDLS